MSFEFRARLKILHYSVTFETDWFPAYSYLKNLTSFFHFKDYEFIESQIESNDPIVQYVNDSKYDCAYLKDLNTLLVHAPWDDFAGTSTSGFTLRSVLLVPIWHMTEFQRQELGEYFFHASAIVRDGIGLVLTGPAESGKTIAALDLCLNHGFSLYANDEVLIGFCKGLPHLRIGDPVFRLRLSSLRKYDPRLAGDIFGLSADGNQAWNTKRDVSPAELGIREVHGTIPVGRFVFLKIDDEATNIYCSSIDGSNHDELFHKQIQFHTELSGAIRGGAYAPIDRRIRSVPFFVPNLDQPEFLRQRITFIESLFQQCGVIIMRGGLKAVTARLDQNLDLPNRQAFEIKPDQCAR